MGFAMSSGVRVECHIKHQASSEFGLKVTLEYPQTYSTMQQAILLVKDIERSKSLQGSYANDVYREELNCLVFFL